MAAVCHDKTGEVYEKYKADKADRMHPRKHSIGRALGVGCTPGARTLRYDEVAFARARSTTSVSRSSSAITSSPSRVAPEWAPHDKGGGGG